MRKITLIFAAVTALFNTAFSQVNALVEAPLNNGSTTQVRAPNGLATSAYMRACALVLPSDLTNIPSGTNISSFGFTMTVGASIPVAGNFTVYMQNTSDLTYLKGTNFATAITGMTQVFGSVMTIPQAVGTASVLLTLSSTFNYTGGGLYIAYDWFCPGPYSGTTVTYLAENGTVLNPGCASASAGTGPAPNVLTATAFRPAFLFGFPNPYTNDIQVVGTDVPGKINLSFNSPHSVVTTVRNSGSAAQTNIAVALNVTGANPYTASQTIPSLAPGAATTVTFTAANPQVCGASAVSVSVLPDQNNVNNSNTYTQQVTYNTTAQNPATGNYATNSVGFGAGSGILAARMLNPVTSTLLSMNTAISTDVNSVNNAVYGVLLSATGATIATTNVVYITSGMLGTTQNFSFSPAQTLAANTVYHVGFAQTANATAYYPAGTMLSTYVTPNLYYSVPLIGGALTPLGQNLGYFKVESIYPGTFSVTSSVSNSGNAICLGGTANLSVTGPTSYSWTLGASQLGVNQSINVSPAVNTAYSLVGTNSLGCNYSAVYTLSVNPLPAVTILSATNAICAGSSISFTNSGALTYSLNNVATGSVVTDSPLANTNYVVSGIDGNGCFNTTTLNLSVYSLTVTVPPNTAICKGKSITLNASGAGTYFYTWMTGTSNSPFPSILVSPSVTTVYTLQAIDANNCVLNNTVSLTVNSNPTVAAAADRTLICKGEAVTITGSGADSYSWSNNATTQAITVSPATNTTYVITGSTTAGCTHSVIIFQAVALCTGINEQVTSASGISIFPNPNNGSLHIRGAASNQVRTVEIFNSLGALVKQQELSAEETQVDLNEAVNGIYLLQVSENNKIIHSAKIIKQ